MPEGGVAAGGYGVERWEGGDGRAGVGAVGARDGEVGGEGEGGVGEAEAEFVLDGFVEVVEVAWVCIVLVVGCGCGCGSAEVGGFFVCGEGVKGGSRTVVYQQALFKVGLPGVGVVRL